MAHLYVSTAFAVGSAHLQGIIIEGQTALFPALQRTLPQFAETLGR